MFQMIGFAETLPAEWESKWKSMQARSRHDLTVEHGKLVYTLVNWSSC